MDKVLGTHRMPARGLALRLQVLDDRFRARAVPGGPPPGPRARSCPAHSTSRSSPSLPISGVLTAACPTIHAL